MSDLRANMWKGLDTLQDLMLTDNQITEIRQDSFGENLPALKWLYLQRNPITNISRAAFSTLPNLVTLNLESTSLTEISAEMFEGASKLERLHLGSNRQITDLPDGVFRHLVSLEGLTLGGSGIKVPRAGMWEGLEHLEGLSFSGSRMEDLPRGGFKNLAHLTHLYFYQNSLTTIRPDMWEGLDSLTHLDLTANRIHTLQPGAFASLLTLQYLNLNDNDLTTLHHNALSRQIFTDDHLPKPAILAQDNPLECDSALCWLMQAWRKDWIEFDYDRRYGSPRCKNYPDKTWFIEVIEVFNCTQTDCCVNTN